MASATDVGDRMKLGSRSKTFLIYACGLGSLLSFDLAISVCASSLELSIWSALRIVALTLAPAALLGLDQALIRNPGMANRISVVGLFQLLGAGIAIYFLCKLLVISVAAEVAGIIVGVGAASLVSAKFRQEGRLVFSQAAQQMWKIALAVYLCLLVLNGGTSCPAEVQASSIALWIAVSSLIGSTLLFSLRIRSGNHCSIGSRTNVDGGSLRRVYGSSFLFVISTLILGLTLYLDQVLLNAFSLNDDLATIFRHASVITPIIVACNGFVTFYATYQARADPERYVRLERQWLSKYVTGAVLLGAVSVTIGYIVYSYSGYFPGRYDWLVACLIGVIGVQRVLFLVPSAFIGVWGSRVELIRFVIVNLLSLLSVASFASLLLWILPLFGMHVVLISLAGCWAARLYNVHSVYRRVAAARIDTVSGAVT